MIIVGIDPGKSGAIAVSNGTDADVFDLPTRQMKKKTLIDFSKLSAMLKEFSPDLVVLELVGGMRRDSGAAAFTFGRAYGVIESAIHSNGLDPIYVPPTVWKRRTRTPTAKPGALAHARTIYPHLSHKLSRRVDHDRAEALMLIKYAEIHLV